MGRQNVRARFTLARFPLANLRPSNRLQIAGTDNRLETDVARWFLRGLFCGVVLGLRLAMILHNVAVSSGQVFLPADSLGDGLRGHSP